MNRGLLAGVAVAAALGLVLALTLNSYYVFVLATIALVAIVGIGLNVLLGLTGQVSFGHVGFYAVGAYAVAILTTGAGWSFWPAWAVGTLAAAALGALLALPALRVKGPYLAMVTIAFSFIVQHAAVEMRDVTGGQNGIMGVPAPALLPGWGAEQAIAVLAIIVAALLVLAYARLSGGVWGAAMRAVRDTETAAASIGLNPLAIKTAAFALSAAAAGLAGGLFAPLSSFVTPDTFSFMQSILFVLVVIIGGTGTVAGPIIGALVVGALPELLASLEAYRLLLFGALLLVVLWVAPEGAAGMVRQALRRQPAPRPPDDGAQAAAAPGDALAQRSRAQLRARGLGMTFGGVRAVADLDVQIAGGAVTSLIGPNGAGKTTALNMLSGFYRPTAGEFELAGADGRARALRGLPAHAIARAGVART